MNQRPMIAVLALLGAPAFAAEAVRVAGKNIRVEFDETMHSRVIAVLGGQQERAVGDFTPSESIRVSGNEIRDFSFEKQIHEPIRHPPSAPLPTPLTAPT